jgi:hypothetical protein
MEVRLSSIFVERVRAMNPLRADRRRNFPSSLLISPRGIIVEKNVADCWAKGTFANPIDSLDYHFRKHGRGRTREHYTYDALRFFRENHQEAQWGRWNHDWPEAFRLKIGTQGGYFTPGGRILAYWDAYEICEATV